MDLARREDRRRYAGRLVRLRSLLAWLDAGEWGCYVGAYLSLCLMATPGFWAVWVAVVLVGSLCHLAQAGLRRAYFDHELG